MSDHCNTKIARLCGVVMGVHAQLPISHQRPAEGDRVRTVGRVTTLFQLISLVTVSSL